MDQKVLIFGTGSVGTVYAWVVSNTTSPDKVVCVCRSNYEAATKTGFTLHSSIWGRNLHFRPTIARSVDDAVRISSGNIFHSMIALVTTEGTYRMAAPTKFADKDVSRPFDFILVASKILPTTPSTAEILRPAVTPGHTAIVLIQNGIGIENDYAELYPDNPIVSCTVRVPATQTSPGVVEHKGFQQLSVGTFPAYPCPQSTDPTSFWLSSDGTSAKTTSQEHDIIEKAPHAVQTPNSLDPSDNATSGTTHAARSVKAAQRFVDMLSRGGANVTLYDDIQAQRWKKLVLNIAWNPVTALSRLRDQHFIRTSTALPLSPSSPSPTSSPEKSYSYTSSSQPWNPQTAPSPSTLEAQDPAFSSLSFIRDLMLEVSSIASAYGYSAHCNPEFVERALDEFLKMSADGIQSSMMADALAGRGMEVEAIVGNAARMGKEKGVEIPILRTVYMLARGLDASMRLG